jgi:ribose transport system permease protein
MKGDNEKLLPTILCVWLLDFFIGILNGLGVTYIGIPALIMTLCMSTVLTKLQIVISNGAPRGTVSKELSSSLTEVLLRVPGIMIWAFLFFLVVVRSLNIQNSESFESDRHEF